MSRVTLSPTQFLYSRGRSLRHTSETSVSTALVLVLGLFVTVPLRVPAFFQGRENRRDGGANIAKQLALRKRLRLALTRPQGWGLVIKKVSMIVVVSGEVNCEVKNHV